MTPVRDNIQAMSGYQPGEQSVNGKLIKLNTNENPYPASSKVSAAINAATAAGLNRYPDSSALAFRIAASGVLGFTPDWFLCGNGSDDILTIATRAFVGQGQTLRLPYPSYTLYRTLAEIQGATYQECRFKDDWSLPSEFAASADGLKLAFLPNPNSPSGTMIPPDDVRQLAERLPCPLLVDEAYVDFAEANCLDLVRENPNVMVSRSFSKSYALAGLRFGFLVAQPQVIDQLRKVKDSYNCDSLSIAGATAAILDQQWQSENREKVMATRDRLEESLLDLGFDVVPSQANFVWCRHTSRSNEDLYEELKRRDILVRYMNYAGWGSGLRISVGTDEQIDAFLQRLNELV